MPRASNPPARRAPAPIPVAAAVAVVAALFAALPAAAPAAAPATRSAGSLGADETPLTWPEEQRAFYQDGPGWLLPVAERQALRTASPAQRQAAVDSFLAADPVPETADNELQTGIARRRELVLQELGTFADDRARLLFLHGRPLQRKTIDCATVFRPLEVWSYVVPEKEIAPADDTRASQSGFSPGRGPQPAGAGSYLPKPSTPDTYSAGKSPSSVGVEGEDPKAGVPAPYLVLYQPQPGEPYKLWQPLDAKRSLYSPELEYLLQQWEELGGRRIARRFDLQLCEQTRLVEEATGVVALTGYRRNRPRREDYEAWLAPPRDLAAWARIAAATPLDAEPPPLALGDVDVFYPRRDKQRLVSQFQISVPAEAGYQAAPAEVSGEPQLRLLVEGTIEQAGRPFDTLRVRFRPPLPTGEGPLALVFDRALRPGLRYLVRLSVRDEVGGAAARRTLVLDVPLQPRPGEVPQPPAGTQVASGEDLGAKRVIGSDNLVLLPPPGETVLNLWRATALVSGDRIERVVFLVDGERQLESRRRPFSAELRLAELPTEQVVRAEGYDAEGNLVAADEVVLNRPRAAFRVRIVSPPEGAEASGTVHATVDVSVPEEKRLEKVEFRVDDELVATLTKPPFETDVVVPGGGDVSFLAVTAELADGTRSEAVRILNAGEGFTEKVDVRLVELYVAAQDGQGRLVRDLGADDFEIYDEGTRQEVRKFELMDALPLTVGFVLDTSGSMADSLSEAQRAAIGFLRRVIRPGDRTFAVAFSDVPTLLMPPTDDVDFVADALSGLRANGWTVLHDAVITALSYFREIEGQQALVLLSDGDDTASSFSFDEALEYARRSEAAIYTIGLDIPSTAFGVRNKLSRLAEETGGRVFFIKRAEELDGVYGEIEEELRSRYLLAFTPQPPPEPGSGFHEIEVKAKRRGVRTRTVRGYYP